VQSAKNPVGYLAGASKISLESFELNRLNQIANLRKELREVMGEWIEAEVEVRFARWVLENRQACPSSVVPFPETTPEPAAIFESDRPALAPSGLSRAIVKHPIPPRLGIAPRKRSLHTRSTLSRKVSSSR
jgi:hypothetical protein